MLQAPATEPKEQAKASRTAVMPEPARLLHPHSSAVARLDRELISELGSASDAYQHPQRLAGLQESIGNQAVMLRLRSAASAHKNADLPTVRRQIPAAIQCMSSTAAISDDGRLIPELSVPSSEADVANVEDPELALAQIEAGTPADGLPGLSQEPGNGSPHSDETDFVQRSGVPGHAAPRSVSPKAVLRRMGGGVPIQSSLRIDMETALGQDFSQVRVHSGPADAALALSLGAHAFTIGEHIAFAPGLYQPWIPSSRRLIAHELAHVVQQRRGLSGNILRRGIGSPNDKYEQEAEALAESISRSSRSSPVHKPARSHSGRADPGIIQCFSGTDAASYAKKWALTRNPSYVSFDDDCTNFASQSMEAGGWSYIFGSDVCDDRKKDSVWWFKKAGCKRMWRSDVDASFTWGGAENFRQFLSSSGRATAASRVSDLEVGDVLQRDHGDGKIHHTMVVTQKGSDPDATGGSLVQLWLSYHTNDTLDRKFWGKGNILDTTPPGWNYFAWKIK